MTGSYKHRWPQIYTSKEKVVVVAEASKVPPRVATPRLTAGVIILLAGLAALSSFATNIILPAFPSMGGALGVTTRELGITLSSFFVAFALGQLGVGPLSDRFGRRPLVLGGLLIFIIGSAVAASASDIGLLVIGRIVQALGVCAASVLSRAIARDLFEGQDLARALSFTTVATAAASGFSPILGTAVDILFGWRMTFLLVGVAGIIMAIAYRLLVGETLAPESRSAVSLLKAGRSYGSLLFDLQFLAPALTVSLIIGGLFGFFAAAPAVLIDGFGVGPLGLSVLFAATVLVVFSGGLLAPRFSRTMGQARATFLGAFLALTGSVLVLATVGAGLSLIWFTLALTVFLFGMGLANPLGTALALQPFGHQAGLASALLGFLQMSCAALATTANTLLPFPAPAAIGIVLLVCTGLAVSVFFLRPTA
jgi:MFS transporter, DHA1 family, multidrug resistance protein